MKIEITAKPVFHFKLSSVAVKALMTLSDHHYDGKCKAAGKQGGFVYGWNNSVNHFNCEDVEATWDNLDTSLKIMESTSLAKTSGLITLEEVEAMKNLRVAFRSCFDQANELYKIWKAEFEVV